MILQSLSSVPRVPLVRLHRAEASPDKVELGRGLLTRIGRFVSDSITQILEDPSDLGTGYAPLRVPADGPEREEYFHKKFLRDTTRQFGKDSFESLGQVLGLADFYAKRYQGMQAAPLYDRAVAILDREFEARGDDAQVSRVAGAATGADGAAGVYARAAGFYESYAKPEQALGCWSKAIALREKLGQPADQERLELAFYHQRQGRHDLAEGVLRTTLERRIERLGAGHPELAEIADKVPAFDRLSSALFGLQNTRRDAHGKGWLLAANYRELNRVYANLGLPAAASEMGDCAREAELADKVKGPSYPGQREDLEWLLGYYRRTDDQTSAFHVEKRLNR